MTTDNLRDALASISPGLAIGAGVAALVVLLAAAWLLRRKGRSHLAGRVTAAATLLGLGWSAQGMWDAAVNRYGQDVVVASILFVVFEAGLASRMLKAHQFRADYARRGRHVTAVWVFASVMALVVASAEGWAQAPARLAIPLLVAYGWYVDLTADDDPKDRPPTSLRWTPRRFALWIGMLEPGERDAEQINHDRLRDRLTLLAFREHEGSRQINDLLRRKRRLHRLLTDATEEDIAIVRGRLAHTRVDLMTTEPVRLPERPKLDVPSVPVRRPAEPGKQGVHERAGKHLRGADLKADAIERLLASVGPDQPKGMPTARLRELYTPPLGERTAEQFAAEARKRINGHQFTTTS